MTITLTSFTFLDIKKNIKTRTRDRIVIKMPLNSPANWNGEVEESQHLGPHIADEQVADDSRCYRRVRRLADAHESAKECETVVVLELIEINFKTQNSKKTRVF